MEKKEIGKYNVIFLDVDGVLNSLAFYKGFGNTSEAPDIDIRTVARLAEICKACDCRIVLSSTWRDLKGSEERESCEAYKYLENCLAEYGLTIYDVTPMHLNNRPEEIAAWLEEHKDEVRNFVSLDDDFSEERYARFGLGGHLVRTDFFVTDEADGGLQDRHVEEAIKILEK